MLTQVHTDDHVSTKFHWQRPHILSPESSATITWDIPPGTPPGLCMLLLDPLTAYLCSPWC